METYSVNVTESAGMDLYDIVSYITEQFMAETTAEQMVDLIEEKLSSLSTFPERVPLVDDERLRELGYRKLGINNYVAFFSIDRKNKTVNVERVLYMRREWESIL